MTVKGILIVVYLDLLLPLAVFLNIYLYFYPVFHFCSFHPTPDGSTPPFRLLALADPQLEGDTTLRRYASKHQPGDPLLSYLDPEHLTRDFHRIRKTIDLWGNDLYLSHIFKTMRRNTGPTHTVVLGDLLGSQWIGNEEFENRSGRFWEIFKNASRVNASDISNGDATGSEWRRKVITLPGNHDIGYAGDINRGRVERFENTFGPVNFMLDFTTEPSGSFASAGDDGSVLPNPSLKIAVLNSMTLDEPIREPQLREESLAFIKRVEELNTGSPRQATILLTHLPFYKPAGFCVDPPLFTYFAEELGGGVREQNHLSEATSASVLSSFFSKGQEGKQKGVILTGHDHEGCEVRHTYLDTLNEGAGGWNVTKWQHEPHGLEAKAVAAAEAKKNGIREITVRSMMGGYGGNAGLLSAWWNNENNSWEFGYSTCALGTQYVWWAVHVIDIIALVAGVLLYSAHNRDNARQIEKAAKMQAELDKKQK